MPGTIEQLVLSRENTENFDKIERAIYITLPDDLKFNRVVKAVSKSGNVSINKCTATEMITAEAKNGNVGIKECKSPFLDIGTQKGKITAIDCITDELHCDTKNGSAEFEFLDNIENYKLYVNTTQEPKISVNGKAYQGGEFTLNDNASKQIHFYSENGSLVIK